MPYLPAILLFLMVLVAWIMAYRKFGQKVPEILTAVATIALVGVAFYQVTLQATQGKLLEQQWEELQKEKRPRICVSGFRAGEGEVVKSGEKPLKRLGKDERTFLFVRNDGAHEGKILQLKIQVNGEKAP